MRHLTSYLRIPLALAACVAAAAILAAPGLGAGRPDDRAGVRGASAAVTADVPDAIDRYLAAQKIRAGAYVPDAIDRYLAGHRVGLEIARPDDRAGLRGDFRSAAPAATGSTSSVAFHWDDAGVGAATLATLMLIAGSGLALARRTMRKRRALSGVL